MRHRIVGRRRVWVIVAAVGASATATALLAPAGAAVYPGPGGGSAHQPPAPTAHSAPGVPGLPSGAPPAATAPPAVLPEPTTTDWPFPSDFSYTEGTGLIDHGASLWTDFVYDDHGAVGNPSTAGSSSGLAPTRGDYSYPTGTGLDGNNADIFRAAVGYDGRDSYWRVDWNSMPDPSIPIAEWTMTPSTPGPRTTTWPANAGLTTLTGLEYALVVTAGQARLLNAATGQTLGTYPTAVDGPARSFIVRIPLRALPVAGTWSIQLASGLAAAATATTAAGPQFATVSPSDGGLPEGLGANAYNVTFRSYQQESELVCPPGTPASVDSAVTTDAVPAAECGNMWMENDQADTLAGPHPDVSKFALHVDWSQLRQRVSVPPPHVYGYSNRWYVTPLNLSAYGAGVRAVDSVAYTGPTYLSRIQPYAVYVPSGYDFDHPSPTPLTWILHSLGENLNQYGAVAPGELAEVCQDRDSICATTEGFSDGGWYYAEAEVDFWDVWHELARAYDLNPEATTISGYSMGGWASYKLPEEYPDLFAQAEPLEGPVICGTRIYGPIQGYAGGTQCTSDGDSTPLLANLKWIPYVMTCGGIDELVPVTGCHTQAADMMADGVRVDEFLYPTEDHLVYAVQNDFGPPDRALATPPLYRVTDPGSFSFTWYPDLVTGPKGVDGAGAAGRIGPTSDYWISGLAGRDVQPGLTAAVLADSAAIPEQSITPLRSTTPHPVADPTPYVEFRQTWARGAAAVLQQAVNLSLTNVAAITVDTAAAGLRCGTVTVKTDGPTALTLDHLAPGRTVRSGGSTVTRAGRSGTATVDVPAGTTTLTACSAA